MMTSLPEIMLHSQNKTRVLLYTSSESVAPLFFSILQFSEKEFDYYLKNQESKAEENDFVIFETSDAEKASQFRPNIVLITDENDFLQIESILKNIVSGGIVIFPQHLEAKIEEQIYYFRRLPYAANLYQSNADRIILKTEIGEIPLRSNDQNLLKNLNGIKLLSQQFGIMEEEFYEAVMNFA